MVGAHLDHVRPRPEDGVSGHHSGRLLIVWRVADVGMCRWPRSTPLWASRPPPSCNRACVTSDMSALPRVRQIDLTRRGGLPYESVDAAGRYPRTRQNFTSPEI